MNSVVATIKSQIGSDALLAVSARDFSHTEYSLVFRFGPRHGAPQKVAVTYMPGSDDYRIYAVRHRRNGLSQVIATYNNVYGDMLGEMLRDINNDFAA